MHANAERQLRSSLLIDCGTQALCRYGKCPGAQPWNSGSAAMSVASSHLVAPWIGASIANADSAFDRINAKA